MHEDIAQELAAARLCLELASTESDTSILEESRNSLARLIERTKGISMKMVPSTFPTIRFDEMVEDLSDRFTKETGVDVQLSCSQMEHIGREQGIILFRVIEEQFKNIEKHSGAGGVKLSVKVNGTFEVLISDNGVGLPAECVTNEKSVNSFQCFVRDEGGPLINDLRE